MAFTDLSERFPLQLNARYSDYLTEYLRSDFSVRQIGNTCQTAIGERGVGDTQKTGGVNG